jgi:pseudouridine kinase
VSLVCIGGACIDRKYMCVEQARPGTSNPARASRSFGGVARNVAENLARLGVPVSLLSVVGDDENGAALLQHAENSGIDTSLIFRDGGKVTSEYTAIVDPQGELVLGVADMRAVESITEAQIARHWPTIERAGRLFVDCNVSAQVLAFCIECCRAGTVQLTVDAVSEVKVRKLPQRLDGVALLFLNEGEGAAYLGAPARASSVRERGARSVVLTRGARGVVVAGDVETEVSAPPARCIDPTGAGDALVATTLYRLLQGDKLVDAVRIGTLGAALTVESNASVHPDLSAWIVS